MPEFHHNWLRPPPAPPPGYFIEAVMLFPNDEQTREAYLQSVFAADVADAAQYKASVSGKLAQWLRRLGKKI